MFGVFGQQPPPGTASFLCERCTIKYPANPGQCKACKGAVKFVYQHPDADWQEKVNLLSAPPSDEPLNEDDKIVMWRAHQLVLAGAPAYEALALAQDRHLDLHKACEVFRGAGVELALRILA